MSRKSNQERRQKEALVRQSAWARLTPEQQIADLKQRPGSSLKQIARLEKKIAITAVKAANNTPKEK